MLKTDIATVASFPSFPRLPIEVQILVWKLAFADSEFLLKWLDRLNSRSYRCLEKGIDVSGRFLPPFWYMSGGKGSGGGNMIMRGGRKAGLPVSIGINRLLHICRLARFSCLELFRDALKHLDSDCSTEIKLIERYIAGMGVVLGPENGMAACIRGLSELPCTPKTSTASA